MTDFLLSWYNLPFLAPIAVLYFYQLLHGIEVQGEPGDLDTSGWDALSADQDPEPKVMVQSTTRVGLLRRLNPYGFPSLMAVIPLVFGTSILGLGFNYYLIFIGELMPIVWVLSAGVSFTLSCGLTRFLLALTNLLLPTDDRPPVRHTDLVGQIGLVVSSQVNQNFGRVRIKLPPNVFTLACEVELGQPCIQQGSQVVLTAYDTDRHRFIAEQI